jgi:poly(hydroxyalkanoate) granule-associated protein
MLKKMKAEAAAAPEGESKDLAQSVLDSSRQIWLAGLGAFARAQAEGQKVFESLVKQGESLETKTKQAAMDTAAAARGAAKAKAKEVQAMAGGTWDKLEQVFEDRVARALSKLGVHTQSDVERLAERVDALSERVNELIKRTGASKPRRETPPAPEGKSAKKRSTTRAATTTAKKARRVATKGDRTH